jgi:hypothetical protein
VKLVRRVALLSLLATPVQATSPMQPDSSPPSLCTSLLLSLADGRLQPDGSSSSRSASATCLGGSRRVARRFRRSAIAAAACRCLPRRFPTCPSISSGAPLEGLGSNPGVEDHLLGHGDHRRHRDRRHRRTAGAPPLHRRTAGGPRVRCLFFRYVSWTRFSWCHHTRLWGR